MQIELCAGRDLSVEWTQQWVTLIRDNQRWRSPFWRPELIAAFSRFRPAIEIARLSDANGQTFGFFPFERKGNNATPAGDLYNDLHGLVTERGLAPSDVKRILSACQLGSFRFHHMPDDQTGFEKDIDFIEPSLSIDISQGFAAYERDLRDRGSKLVRRVGQRMRKLGREVGEPQLRESRQSEDLLLLADWKRASCQAKGWGNLYDRPGLRQLYAELLRREGDELRGRMFLLTAGERPIAGVFALQSGDAWHAWKVAHDPAMSRFSPGLATFVMLLQQAAQLNIATLDLSRGEERFKQELGNRSSLVWEGHCGGSWLSRSLRRAWLISKQRVSHSRFSDSARQCARAIRRLGRRLTLSP